MLESLLMSMGLGKTAAKFGSYAILALAAYLALLWWGNSRYNAGVEDTDAKWAEASAKLEHQAEVGAAQATGESAARVEQHNERLAAEKEKLDEAERTGSSAIDALFPVGGV